MKKIISIILVAVAAASLLLLPGCGKKAEAATIQSLYLDGISAPVGDR